jgi:hypothetical protein
MAAHGSPGVTLGYDAYLRRPDGITWYSPIRVHTFTPDGVLSDAIDDLSDEIVVAAGVDLDRLASVSEPEFPSGENLIWMVTEDGLEEFVAFQNVSGTSVRTLSGLARGCLDTAPTAFPAGTRVWFISYGHEIVSVHDPEPPATTRENTIRFQSYNGNGSCEFDGCEDATVVASARGEGLLPDQRQVQRRELPELDLGRAHGLVVAPEPARGVVLRQLGRDGERGGGHGVRRPRLWRARDAGPH